MKVIASVLPFVCCISLVACAQVADPAIIEAKLTQNTSAAEASARVATNTTTLQMAKAVPLISAAEFSACVNSLSEKARLAGISPGTIANSLARASLSPRVLELDRQQPEFTTTFADYLNRRVTTQRVEQGRALLVKHRALLDAVAQQYGVPAPYLLAFWGLETNYGSFFGNMSVMNSLATLACDQRRSDYFTAELISALRIIDEGAITPEKMLGSWAGAMGHVQFMPSAFLKHAVDYDGDNKRDLWNSTPDAMASAAKFLQSLGWHPSERWGREVKLPLSFPFLEAGLKNSKSLSEWSRLGVMRADNTPLPQTDVQASLLVPSGHKGPVFLVYDNFNVIMRWNRSEFYAIAVGYLADRIAGAERLQQPPPEDAPRLHRDQVIKLQENLNQKGFDAGIPDGIFGPGTRRAIGEFQHQQGLIADGFPEKTVLALLGINLEPVKKQ
ncbi:MAG TPA: lytic murein transglycosylase [Cellvibrio sp.]|nr:lytic murein transglycosylase [Cellvibrio sp.]